MPTARNQDPFKVDRPAEPTGLMVYLAGPIDQVVEDEATSWRLTARSLLTYKGFASFNPAGSFRIGRVDADQIRNYGRMIDSVNRTAIKHSDAVLCLVLRSQETLGTWREIEFAKAIGKPVFMAAPGRLHHIALWDIDVFDTLEEAITALEDYFQDRQSVPVPINVPGMGKIFLRRMTMEEAEEMARMPGVLDVSEIEPLG